MTIAGVLAIAIAGILASNSGKLKFRSKITPSWQPRS
jgi:hypothetical protein